MPILTVVFKCRNAAGYKHAKCCEVSVTVLTRHRPCLLASSLTSRETSSDDQIWLEELFKAISSIAFVNKLQKIS